MPTPVNTITQEKWHVYPLTSTVRTVDVKQGYTGGNFVTPMSYYRSKGVCHNYAIAFHGFPLAINPTSPPQPPFYGDSDARLQALRNQAYSRLENRVNGTKSQLGTFAVEWRESLGMVANRAHGLWSAYRDFRKGRFRSGLRKLSVSPKRKHRGKLRNSADEAAGLWLEYWFGWSPLVEDIVSSVAQLAEPLPESRPYYGSASGSFSVNQTWTYNVGAYKGDIDVRVSTGANFTLSNPNTYLFSQLGMLNPGTVAWEVIPFSFLVDWVADVSSFIESFSDFAGLTVTEPWNNIKLKTQWQYILPVNKNVTSNEWVVFKRSTTLLRPLPNLNVLANLGQSATRAASAVSLLVKILKV